MTEFEINSQENNPEASSLSESLVTKTVGDLWKEGYQFYVANYQRGYRWGKDEIETLIKDIDEFRKEGSKRKYCLQPLVVRKREDAVEYSSKLDKELKEENGTIKGAYEVIDGQQRLTTLYLILSHINAKLGNDDEGYGIHYENLRNIDKHFIENAGKVIKDKTKKNLKKIRDAILNQLTFIWYEVDEGDVEKIFRKTNKGKIELTNAELFKAMLLNDEGASGERKTKLEQISFEWDKLEQSLSNDDFWFFISNDKSEERTRIDYILEVYAKGLKNDSGYADDKERYSFLVVEAYLEKEVTKEKRRKEDVLNEIWEAIVDVHDKLYSWYLDDVLYHQIGFLVASEGHINKAASPTVTELYEEAKDLGIKDARKIAKRKVPVRLSWLKEKGQENPSLDRVDYRDRSKAELRMFLLYTSIYPLLQIAMKREEAGMEEKKKRQYVISRFPFAKYHAIDWDIEHINPRNPIKDLNEAIEDLKKKDDNPESERVKVYLGYTKDYLVKAGEWNLDPSNSDEKEIVKAWNAYVASGKVKEYEEDVVNKAHNLVLLDHETNIEYKNAIFGIKRSYVAKRDKEGKFIPDKTKEIFLHYDERHPDLLVRSDESQQEYEDFLEEMLGFIFDRESESV